MCPNCKHVSRQEIPSTSEPTNAFPTSSKPTTSNFNTDPTNQPSARPASKPSDNPSSQVSKKAVVCHVLMQISDVIDTFTNTKMNLSLLYHQHY